MSDTHMAMQADDGLDDLPRTLRRAREAKERESQQARESLDPPVMAGGAFAPLEPEMRGAYVEELTPAVLRRIDVPFHRLVTFFLKAVIAAIPALILLGIILWGAGYALKLYLPQLVHTEILIRIPR